MELSEHQIRLINGCMSAGVEEALFLIASAGSGKSTTLLECSRELGKRGAKGRIICFNNSAAVSMSQRLRENNVAGFSAMTFHSLGKSLLEAKYGRMEVNRDLLGRVIGDYRSKLKGMEMKQFRVMVVQKIVGIMRSACVFSADDVHAEMERRGEKEFGLQQIRDQIGHAKNVVKKLGMVGNEVDFDGMVYRVVEESICDRIGGSDSWLMVDEAQDMTECDLRFVMHMLLAGNRVVFAGDPFQSINNFRGALEDSINSAIERVKGYGIKATEYILPVSFRLPQTHVSIAKIVNHHIEPNVGAERGVVSKMSWNDMLQTLRDGDRVICRVNAPLLSLANRLLKMNKRVSMKDTVFKNVENLVRFGDGEERIDDILKKIEQNEEKLSEAIASCINKNEMDRLTFLMRNEIAKKTDLKSFCAGCTTKGDVLQMLQNVKMCSNNDVCNGDDSLNTVRLSTVHSAKGLEADRVFVLLNHPMMPLESEWNAPVHAMSREEMCCWYVAMTRAKEELIYVSFSSNFATIAHTDDWSSHPSLQPHVVASDAVSSGGKRKHSVANYRKIPKHHFPESVALGESINNNNKIKMDACLLCGDKGANCVVEPCGHCVMCGSCTGNMPNMNCVVCKEEIIQVKKKTRF